MPKKKPQVPIVDKTLLPVSLRDLSDFHSGQAVQIHNGMIAWHGQYARVLAVKPPGPVSKEQMALVLVKNREGKFELNLPVLQLRHTNDTSVLAD